MKNKNLEQQLRELAKKFSKESGSDNDAFRLMKKILQDELGYQFFQSATKPKAIYTNNTTNNNQQGVKMTHSKFTQILRQVQRIHLDIPDGITDEMAFDIATDIMADNPGLKEYIQNRYGASDAVGWLMCEM